MVVFSVLVAASFPVSAAITVGIDPVVLTFWRFLAATAVFGLMLPFAGEVRRPGWRDLGHCAIVGGSYGLFFILMFQALKETSSLNTSTIQTTLPLLTVLLGWLLGEALPLRQLAVLALSMVATLWVIFHGDWQRMLALDVSRGDAVFFVGTCCMAVYMQAMKRQRRGESILGFTFTSLLMATAALAVAAFWRTGGLAVPAARVWLGLAYLAGPSTAGTFWLLRYATPRLGPGRVVAYTFLTPSLVAGLDWGLGLSPPEWVVLPGIAVTLVAVWLLQLESVAGHRGGTDRR